jgi:hypothetical protein
MKLKHEKGTLENDPSNRVLLYSFDKNEDEFLYINNIAGVKIVKKDFSERDSKIYHHVDLIIHTRIPEIGTLIFTFDDKLESQVRTLVKSSIFKL